MELDEIIRTLTSMLKLIIEDNDILPLAAKGVGKLHKELCDQGFSREEALEIVCAFSHMTSRK